MADPDCDDVDPMPQLFMQLASCPISQIVGAVDASGSGACMSPGDDSWSLGFGLAAWRVDGGAVERGELYVRRKVSRQERDELMAQINADTVIRLQARFARENVLGTPQALLERFEGVDQSDLELSACLDELLIPARFSDAFFGEFVHERTVDVYSASTKWRDVKVALRLWFMEGEVQSALDAAHLLWKDSNAWDELVRDCAVRELLPLKNGLWQNIIGPSLSRRRFEKRMSLRCITVEPNGDFRFSYDDGNLFFGHDIVVYGNVQGGVTSANIEG